jgi:hypothetical protein
MDRTRELTKKLEEAKQEVNRLNTLLGVTGDVTRDVALGVADLNTRYYDSKNTISDIVSLTSELKSLGSSIFKLNRLDLSVLQQQNESTENQNNALNDAVAKILQKVKFSNDDKDITNQINESLLTNNTIQKLITKEAEKAYTIREQEKDASKKASESLNNDINNLEKEISILEDRSKYENEISKKSELNNVIATKIAEIEEKRAELNKIRDLYTKSELDKNVSIADLENEIKKSVENTVSESVKIVNEYSKYNDLLETIQDSQIATGDILSRDAATRAKISLEEYKTKNKFEDKSKEFIDLKFQEFKLGTTITELEKDRGVLVEKLKNATEEESASLEKQLAFVDNLLGSSQLQLNVAKENVTNLERVEELEKKISEEKKKQNIEEEVKKSLTEKITSLLGDQGEEISSIGKAIKDSMTSPLALVGALIGHALEEYMKLGRESRKFLDDSKLTVKQSEHALHYAHDLSLEYRAQGVEMSEVLESTNALVGVYGSINRVSDTAVEKATLLGKAFGISADNAAKTMYQIQASTGASAETAGNIAALGAQFAEAAGVAPDLVMQDIAGSSQQIATYFKGTPQDLLRTAVEARRLGLDIGKVADISKTLLDFESSIEDQMTASVLLGREINLDKARELAMQGKIEEAAKETLGQIGSLADFNKMNAVQKEAIAKAAGLTVGELQQSLEKQDAINNMTAEQRKEYEKGLQALNQGNESAADRLLKEQRNQLTQEKIADAVAKISDIFANVLLPVLEPIFDLITGIFGVIEPVLPYLKTGLQLFLGWKAVTFLINTQFFKTRGLLGTLFAPIQAVGKGLGSAKDGIVNAYKSTKEWFTKLKEGDGIWKSLKNSMKNALSGLKTFLVGKGFKEWSNDSKKSFENASKSGKSFFDKMQEWAKKFSFKPVEEGVSSVTESMQKAAQEKAGELIQKPAEGATETIQDKATGKVEEIVGGKVDSAVEGLQGKAEEKGKELIGRVTESVSPDKVSETAEMAQTADANVKSGAGEGIKTFLTNLSEGLKSMGQAGVFKGALNLIPASLGLVAMIPGYLGAKLLEKLDGEKIQENLYGLAYGLEAFAKGKVLAGASVLLAAAIGFTAMTAGAVGLALIAGLGIPAGAGLSALAAGLMAMANPAVAGGVVILAGLALSLGASLMMAGAGIFFAAKGMEALVIQFKEMSPEQILATAAAFVGFGIAVGIMASAAAAATAGILGLAAIGGLMLVLSTSLLIAAPAIDSISNSLTNLLANVSGDSLISIGIGLVAVAGGIGSLAIAALGFTVAIIPLTIFTGLMGLLGTALKSVGTGINSIVTGIDAFATTMTTLLPMVDQIGILKDAFTDLAVSIGKVGAASILAFPSMAALGGVASFLGGLFGKEEAPAAVPTIEPAPMSTTGAGTIAPTTTATTTPTTATAESEGASNNSELIAKMNDLIAVITNSTTPIQLVVDGKVLAEAVGRKTERNYQANPRK